MLLLQKCLKTMPGVDAIVVLNGWPKDEEAAKVFEGASAVAFFMDGGGGHPILRGNRPEILRGLIDKGVGFVCIHYTVEVPKGKWGEMMLDWLGGYYESGYSRNPMNTVQVTPAAEDHPISRGLAPRVMTDEFYYNIRFRPGDTRVTPILTMIPKDKPDMGVQTIAWATQRENGGRSFGFTGGHFHKNWLIPEFRKLVLNAIIWAAKLEVPAGGFACEITEDDLKLKQAEEPPKAKRGPGKKS
ncbi:MAG: ThuA domain-containing protein [Planctomycetes bacterium]|nr:ThuA domain-containing protein [Planctomycetota bacterium]